MSYLINPGSGPVANASFFVAQENVRLCLSEAAIADIDVTASTEKGDDGRYSFWLSLGGVTVELDMPGVPAEVLRAKSGIPPRLYVDGSSWWWEYALNRVRETFGEDEG